MRNPSSLQPRAEINGTNAVPLTCTWPRPTRSVQSNPGARFFELFHSQNIVLLQLLASSMLCRRWELWVERTGRERRQTDTGRTSQAGGHYANEDCA